MFYAISISHSPLRMQYTNQAKYSIMMWKARNSAFGQKKHVLRNSVRKKGINHQTVSACAVQINIQVCSSVARLQDKATAVPVFK